MSEIGVKAVHNAIDKRIIEPKPGPRTGKAPRRGLTGARNLPRAEALARDRVPARSGRSEASVRGGRRLSPDAKTIRADDLIIVDVAEARRQVAARMRDLDEAEAAIHRVKGIAGGEPVFKGTRIPVRVIAAMLAQGVDEREILEGYPKLTAKMLRLAWNLVRGASDAGPPEAPFRPRPSSEVEWASIAEGTCSAADPGW